MTTDNTPPETPGQPDVRPGQVWADNDKREAGRTIRVERVDGRYAHCTVLTVRTASIHAGLPGAMGRPTRIALTRFRPTATGYRLVRDVKAGESS